MLLINTIFAVRMNTLFIRKERSFFPTCIPFVVVVVVVVVVVIESPSYLKLKLSNFKVLNEIKFINRQVKNKIKSYKYNCYLFKSS